MTAGDVAVRSATAHDLSAILSIEASSKSVTWSAGGFEQELSDGNVLGVIAHTADGSACGYILGRCAADECTIHTVAVLPSFQRHGIGRTLVDAMIAKAVRRQCATLFLEVRSRNGSARAFYESLGFLRRGIRKAYYGDDGDDAIIMSRPLFLSE
jgi:[ribosomal protein S18]-alanine N-acetyltransferase